MENSSLVWKQGLCRGDDRKVGGGPCPSDGVIIGRGEYGHAQAQVLDHRGRDWAHMAINKGILGGPEK